MNARRDARREARKRTQSGPRSGLARVARPWHKAQKWSPHRSKRVLSVPLRHEPPRPLPSQARLRPRGSSSRAQTALLAVLGHQEPPPGAEQRVTSVPAATLPPTPALPERGRPEAHRARPVGGRRSECAAPATPAPEAYAGPYFVVTEGSAGVYGDTSASKKQKIGYLRSGSRVPVSAEPVPGEECTRGWYRIRDGGFVCGAAGTTNTTSPEARFAIRSPDLAAVLPYTYARNAKNGTPLYRSVPTAEQMRTYEPYLASPKGDDDHPATAKAAETSAKADQAALPFSKEALERHRDTATPTDDRLDKSAGGRRTPRRSERASRRSSGAGATSGRRRGRNRPSHGGSVTTSTSA